MEKKSKNQSKGTTLEYLFEVTTLKNGGKPLIVLRTKEELLEYFRMETIAEYLKDIQLGKYDDMRNWLRYHSEMAEEMIAKITDKQLGEIWMQSIWQIRDFTHSKLQAIYERTHNVSIDKVYKDGRLSTVPLSNVEHDINYFMLAKSIITTKR